MLTCESLLSGLCYSTVLTFVSFVDRDMYMRYRGGGVGHYRVELPEDLAEPNVDDAVDTDDSEVDMAIPETEVVLGHTETSMDVNPGTERLEMEMDLGGKDGKEVVDDGEGGDDDILDNDDDPDTSSDESGSDVEADTEQQPDDDEWHADDTGDGGDFDNDAHGTL